MKFLPTPLAGAFTIDLVPVSDDRGYFARAWCSSSLREHGLNPNVTQLNVAFSHTKGTLRGMHYQRAPHAEAKLVRCTRGSVYDVVIDLRPESATRGRWHGVELCQDKHRSLYVPEGFAHGYQTLSDDTEIQYLTTASYAPAAATGVRYDDPAFHITWPLPVTVISLADRNWQAYSP